MRGRTSWQAAVAAALGLSAAPAIAAAGGDADPAGATSSSGTIVVDTLRTDRPSHDTALSHLAWRIEVDAARRFGWPGATLHVEAIADHGGKPSARVGTLQGLDNIEVARNAVRLYSTWLQQAFAEGASLRAGLYDLNSEFYATEASAQLIHPAFGIGSELAQSGRNGPSIFPTLSIGARLRVQATAGAYAQAVLLDAVPGDPDHPGRTVVRTSARDGALIVGEAGWLASVEGERTRRWGVGAWTYSRAVPRIDGAGGARSAGVYAIAEGPVPGAPASVAGFVRAGLAAPRVSAIDAAFDAGLSIDRPWGERGPSFVAGIAASRLGADHRRAAAIAGATLPRHEIAIEIGLPWRLAGGLTVQPVAQHVRHAAGRPGAPAAATLVGLRWIVAIGDGAP